MITEIEKLKACHDAVDFRKKFDTFNEAWNNCHRGDWMLWLADKLNVDKRLLTLTKGRCAETVIHLMEDKRSIEAVNKAIAYGNGEIHEDQLKQYASAASAAYYDAASDYAAAYAYAAADADDYDVDSMKDNQLQTSSICRELLTDAVMNNIKSLDDEN